MKDKIKGISLTWLSKVDLSNLNSGEGGSNYIDVKKFKANNIDYPYVSGQAMRHYIKSAIRRLGAEGCILNEKGEGCRDIQSCIICDLFGFMSPKAKSGAETRISPVKVSPAIGLYPLDENITVDFLTRKKYKGEKYIGDIVHVELAHNLYRCGISIDIRRVSAEEIPNSSEAKIELKEYGGIDQAKIRIKLLLRALLYLTEASKQSRLLTDFTPDFLVITFQKHFSNRIQKALSIQEYEKLDLVRFESIINDLKFDDNIIIVGMLPNTIREEQKIKKILEESDIPIFSPKKAIEESVKLLEKIEISR